MPRCPAGWRSAPTATGSCSAPKPNPTCRPGRRVETPAGQVFVRDLTARDDDPGHRCPQPGNRADDRAARRGRARRGAQRRRHDRRLDRPQRRGPDPLLWQGRTPDPTFNYYLWRRAPFGSAAPTRRVTGLADPDDPVCRQLEEENPGMVTIFNPTSTGPCYGPLTDQEGNRSDISSQLPALSGDGYTVAFLTGAGPRPAVPTRTRPRPLRHRHETRPESQGRRPSS